MTRALITGITGQDGWYLAHELHGAGIEVWGTSPTTEVPADLPFVRAAPPIDLGDADSLTRAINAAQPDQIYHLAAQSSVAASWDDPVGTIDATGLGTVRVLEAVRAHAPAARVFVASSSEVFGEPERCPQDEETRIRPISPYGAAKALAQHHARIARDRHGLFVSCGILYNHESPRRPPAFVTRKITQAAVAISRGEQAELRLGNLDARRDWGFAGDYVRAMRLMLEQETPGDYVIATGVAQTVREFCQIAFAEVGLDYERYVVTDPAFWRPAEAIPLVGDASKAKRDLGWTPETDLAGLIRMLVAADREASTARETTG